ncbi:MAG TPA: hypothetical protein VIK53_08540 [Verrucomicrobiae bacterium]
MSTTKLKPAPNGAAGATASNEPHTYRINPETEAKIDNWIKQNPKGWDYIKTMPRDRLERTVVLNDVRKMEARQRTETGVMQQINNDPVRKQAYDILTKDMPEERREEVILGMEREKWRAKQKTQGQTQTRREGVSV